MAGVLERPGKALVGESVEEADSDDERGDVRIRLGSPWQRRSKNITQQHQKASQPDHSALGSDAEESVMGIGEMFEKT